MTVTLHDAWQIVYDLSAARAGNDEYDEVAGEHTKLIDSFSEEELADFTAKANAVAASAEAFKDMIDNLAEKILEEHGLPDRLAKWTSADVHKYLGVVQTKGEFAEVLTVAILAVGDPRVLLAHVEPAEDEELEGTDGD